MSIISEHDRMQLKKMIAHNGGMEDNTSKIRENNHSGEIRRCIQYISDYKRAHPTLLKEDKIKFEEEVLKEAGFLFFHYMDIYNLVLKQDDLSVLDNLINVLENIENGVCDQNEGSYLVGKLLKEIYIDTWLRKTSSQDDEDTTAASKVKEAKEITWAQFKTQQPDATLVTPSQAR
jgi:hypothetical protein